MTRRSPVHNKLYIFETIVGPLSIEAPDEATAMKKFSKIQEVVDEAIVMIEDVIVEVGAEFHLDDPAHKNKLGVH